MTRSEILFFGVVMELLKNLPSKISLTRKKLLFLLLLTGVYGCNPVDYSHVRVVKVIDGDTVKLQNGKNLRYIGMDTPEVRIKEGGRFIYNPQPFSLEATELNRQLVEGKYVRVEFDVNRIDKYGRLLGYCFAGDTFVNAELVRRGLAVIYTYPPNVKYTELFIKLQDEARNNRRGIWGEVFSVDASQASGYINQIQTISGKVVSSRRTRETTLINLGNRGAGEFTIVIFQNSLPSFLAQGIDPATFYKGKKVEISARIRKYRGRPQAIASTPAEIKILP